MKSIRRIRLRTVEDALTLLSALAIMFILAVTTLNVIGRYFFKLPVPGSIEIAAALLILVAYLNISADQRLNLHIGLDGLLELTKRKSPRIYHGLQLFNLLIFLLIMVLVGYYFVPTMLDAMRIFLKTRGPLFLPVWPLQLVIIIGCFLVCLRLLTQIYEHLRLLLSPQPKVAIVEKPGAVEEEERKI